MDISVLKRIQGLRTYAEWDLSGDGCQAIAFATLPKSGCANGTEEIQSKMTLVPITGRQLTGTSKHIEHREWPMREWYDRILLRTANDLAAAQF
jgi:hypothetical protein